MDPKKIFLLTKVSEKIDGKSESEVMPILLAAMTSAQKQHISFSAEEIELLFAILKEGRSGEEISRMNQTLEFAKNILFRG